MRPKKKVAVLDANEVGLLVWSFVLDVWGYKVVPVQHLGRGAKELRGVEVALTVLPERSDRRRFEAARRRHGFRVLSLEVGPAGASSSRADVTLLARSARMEVREALRILAARKRGPKKGCAGRKQNAA